MVDTVDIGVYSYKPNAAGPQFARANEKRKYNQFPPELEDTEFTEEFRPDSKRPSTFVASTRQSSASTPEIPSRMYFAWKNSASCSSNPRRAIICYATQTPAKWYFRLGYSSPNLLRKSLYDGFYPHVSCSPYSPPVVAASSTRQSRSRQVARRLRLKIISRTPKHGKLRLALANCSGDPRWQRPYEVVSAVQGNGGLSNAINASVERGTLGEVITVGLIGFPTHPLNKDQKVEIY
ncbi:hypothetical protein DM02DRAFT_655485 [Periconia macrospinosa]|uniref:Uncharacterized protein n=1 Tax=Periconia macrospinosa TaxID=97972 RepID=A0A2V1DQE7_9PLEO|nr:hypothetical protein DM02DRAFT_655485 [Periconia macrospinosa]